jgi:organic hydroperoxide reductase OsmC/OhrA
VAGLRAKVFEYAIEVGRDGATSLPGGASVELPAELTPDHLLLAALVHCSIQSLAYHARRSGRELEAHGSASGRVTRRPSDGRYAFVEIECRIEAALTPPAADASELIANAERDCFVGATLAVTPRYEWRLR